ncbi:hypothetical protein DUI37_28435 [Bacillus anthracis]|nr:hypothetical protein DUI37_28435 [Bacillus anthracis]
MCVYCKIFFFFFFFCFFFKKKFFFFFFLFFFGSFHHETFREKKASGGAPKHTKRGRDNTTSLIGEENLYSIKNRNKKKHGQK